VDALLSEYATPEVQPLFLFLEALASLVEGAFLFLALLTLCCEAGTGSCTTEVMALLL